MSRTNKRQPGRFWFNRIFYHPVSPIMLLVAAIALTVIAWYISHKSISERASDRFAFEIKEIESAILERMLEYEQVLRGGVGLFHSNKAVTREQWHEYVQTLQLEKYYPGIQGLGFSMKVPPGKIDSLEKAMRADGLTDFKVWPDSARDEYHSIVYLEPFNARNKRAFGYDMFSEEKRRQAMERARDEGIPALSRMVVLVQEIDVHVQRGCLLYLPVYARDVPLTTAEDRRAALKGFVYSAFRMKDLMRGILGTGSPDIEFHIYDGGSIESNRLFYSSNGDSAINKQADFVDSSHVVVAGRKWTLLFHSNPGFISPFEANQPAIIAVGGILVDLLLFYVLLQMNLLGRRNRMLAERFKAEKDRYEIIARSTNDVLWDWDLVNDTIKWNENYHHLFGYPYSEKDFPPASWYEYLHPDDRDRVVMGIHEVIDSRKEAWSDEYRFRKADGSYLYILDRGKVIHDASGKSVRMVGTMIDITDRKHAEEAQKRFSEELEKTVQQRTVELQRSNDDLQRFAHVASHDLKEPVRKILTFISLLEARYQPVLGEGNRLVEKMHNSAYRLKKMIEGILAFSSFESGTRETEAVDLNQIITHVKEDLELLIGEKQATIHSTDLPVVPGSTVLLHQLFYNLIHNSLKFSRPGVPPVIRISCEMNVVGNRQYASVTVADNGIGFEQKDADVVFGTFVRLHSKDRFEGTGLGLALCKKIVERHQGSIQASSVAEQGATFLIRLPVA